MSDQREFDLGDDAVFDSEYEEMMAGLEIAAGLFRAALKVLNAPTPSESQIASVLDFFGPCGAGRGCFFAFRYLELGESFSVAIDDEYDVVVARVRQQIQRMQAAGRIKEAGQPRQTKPKPAPEGQGDLFEGV